MTGRLSRGTLRSNPLVHAGVRRTGWGLVDQVVSSGTNFAVGVILARTLSLEDFGAFSIAFFFYTFALSLARAYPLDPLLIRYSRAPAGEWRRGASAAVGTSTSAGVVSAVGLLTIGAIVGGPLGSALVALAVTFPGLLMQDAWRVSFFAAGRSRDAFLNDVAWAVFLVPGLSLAALAGGSVFATTLAWGSAASAAAIVGSIQARAIPRPDLMLAWWREHADLAPRFLLESGLRAGSGQLAIVAIGAIAGLTAVGSIRAAQLVVAPVQVLYMGATLVAVPEAVRVLANSLGRLMRLAVAASLALGGICIAWGVTALVIPPELGQAALGDAWDAAREFLPAAIIAQLGNVLIIGPGMMIRAFANARLSLRITWVTATASMILPVAAATGGGLAAAWGLAVASMIGAAVWWLALPSGVRTWRGSVASAEVAAT